MCCIAYLGNREQGALKLLRKLKSLLFAGAASKALDEELAFHLENHVQYLMGLGMSEEAARVSARKEFGNLTLSKEECRDAGRFGWLDNLWQDLRSGYRGLRRSPLFAITIIATLALGIGATSALFAVVDTALLRPLSGPEPERLVWLQEFRADHEQTGGNPPRFADWQRARSFNSMCGFYSDSAIFVGADGPARLRILHTLGDPAKTLAPALRIGRMFTAAENRGEGQAVALITVDTWRRYLGSTPDVLHRTLRLGSAEYQVVGVLDSAPFPEHIDLWVPMSAEIAHTTRQAGFLGEVARLGPGVSREGAQTEINLIVSQSASNYPATDKGRSAELIPLQEFVTHEARKPLLTLLAAAGAVLLIACVNIAGLLISRGLARQREAAIRISVGAGFLRLARLFFAESLLLAGSGCLLGLFVASAGIHVLKAALPSDIPHLEAVSLDWRVVVASVALAAVCALVFGAIPAWQFASKGQVSALKKTSRSRLRAAFVVIEVALSLILLVAAGLLTGSFLLMRDQPAGFSAANAYSFAVPFGWDSDPAALNSFAAGALSRLTTSPGVVSAGVVDQLPLHGGSQSGEVLVQGLDLDQSLATKEFSWRTASAGYFAAAGIPLKAGTLYRDWMAGHGDNEALITDRLASLLFPNGNAVGHLIAESPRNKDVSKAHWFRIAGIIGSVRVNPSDQSTEAGVYVPWGATYWPEMNFVVKSTADLTSFSRLVRNHVQPLTNAAMVEKIDTLESLTAETRSSERVRTIMLAAFAGAALALSAIGLFGTLSHEVARRTRDYGVRLALGAKPERIAWSAVQSALSLALLGLVIGVAGSIWTSQLLRGLLFGIEPSDPSAYLAAIMVLLATSVSAAIIPAIKAARIDPIQALRHE